VESSTATWTLVVTDAIGTPLLAIPGDPVAHLPEPGKGLHVHVDQLTRALPLVPVHRRSGFQVPQSPEAQTSEDPGHGEEGCLQEPGDVPEVQPLMAEIHGLLELLRTERPSGRLDRLSDTGRASGRRSKG
jgi:hypothetical protein